VVEANPVIGRGGGCVVPCVPWILVSACVLGKVQIRFEAGGARPPRRGSTSSSRGPTSRRRGLPAVVARLFNIGLRQARQYGIIVPRFVRLALAGELPQAP
jgi:hypothetical protein